MDDAHLWLLGTEGQTKIVVILFFMESQLRGNPVEDTTDANSNTEEQTLIDSVNQSTTQINVAEMLAQLNQCAKWKTPFIGDLSAALHLFRATKDYEDIEEFFNSTVLPLPVSDSTVRSLEVPPSGPSILPVLASNSTVLPEPSCDSTAPTTPASASTIPLEPPRESSVPSVPPSDRTIPSVLASDSTVLPSPPNDSTVPPVLASVSTRIREFQISLEDIFGNDLPKVLDPKYSIVSLRELEEHVIGSLPGTTWSSALQPAKKHMKEKGVWKERETFAQSKRRRRS